MQHRRVQQLDLHRSDQRLQRDTDGADPFGQGRARQFDAAALIDLLVPSVSSNSSGCVGSSCSERGDLCFSMRQLRVALGEVCVSLDQRKPLRLDQRQRFTQLRVHVVRGGEYRAHST
jgi:hypothetical protein